ncbi:BppU family phage baseplate upper protein [Staphylococcus pettenkoferi]|uniref:BppU family phage baseplate upper protein n=1 Tax=Staphylococcus pettenkoferi TaxID=170573 RepID=A0ABT4BIJ2_9STAP|nr:BppU family phage baseplate upper protein [Staphylococcus pettenkoferi]MCI2802365.1 BppU family phage baseplate upper protein [Staphylococcus pettenkoferi]MCY1582433.1 BppU family phage baseplate upper protein [Staphylococcus pettenkoferi]MCY1596630.1 BppU family phage baseplate upper protein [Staphylococcus pettenkoferi]MCY1602464.1 BppU family phage baseplate upper protein [Staphylococcus pettenkoferi]MCY1615448.1 BppU family phage baseplate upper protein [Staphylococcus pettenkoferi]
MDGFYKEARITTVDEPYLKPISDEGIGFYNMDINTAVLTFQVRREINGENYPLEISKANTEITAYFVSDNGSSTGRVKVEFVDPMQGIIRLTLDNDFLKASTDTSVTGQIYIKAVGRKDTVVLNEFRFHVADALINQIDGDIKIRYIREIDDLVDLVKDRIETVSKELENVQEAENEFLNFVNTQKSEFVKQVTDLRNQMENFSKQTEIEITDYLNTINDKVLEVNERLNAATEGVITEQNLEEHLIGYAKKEEVGTELSKKANEDEFKALSDGLDELIQNKVNEAINKAMGQQIPLTESDGAAIRLDNVDLSTMNKIDKTGFYYLYNPTNSPDPDNQSGYAIVISRSETYKKVLFMPYNKHRIYSRNMMGETTRWGSWYDATKGVVIPGSNPVV